MKIPKKIKIGGKIYRVIIENLRDKAGSGDMSMVHPAQQKIWISNEMVQEQQESCFIHEIIEGIKFDNDLKLTHQTLQTLGEQLYQVFKDNKLLK